MTLSQAIKQFVENICVTDRQEDSIKTSLDNIYSYLADAENGLSVERTFTNGSYDRDTIIRPLDDIDIFAVLSSKDWEDEYNQLPKPQAVLSKMKKYLNSIPVYENKVNQDRPCVTIRLSDKDFDILPAFAMIGGGYLIPNFDLSGWTESYPERLFEQLEDVHRLRNYKVKEVIKAVKQWNRGLDKLIPSFHIEEIAIAIFNFNDFTNYREGIECWFKTAEYYLLVSKMKSSDDFAAALQKIKAVAKKLAEASDKYDENKEGEAIQIWKNIFGREFPAIDPEEAKNFAKSITEGRLKVASSGLLSTTVGNSIGASSGYHGGLSKK